jgi:hypothetical protein
LPVIGHHNPMQAQNLRQLPKALSGNKRISFISSALDHAIVEKFVNPAANSII